jgi:hypothetical protein
MLSYHVPYKLFLRSSGDEQREIGVGVASVDL